MEQVGHTDPKLALAIYAKAMRRGDDEKARLRALVEGSDWGQMGTNAVSESSEPTTVDSVSGSTMHLEGA